MTTKNEREVEIVVAWKHYCVGKRIAPGGMLGGWLVQHGFAKWVDELPQAEPAKEPEVTQLRVEHKSKKRDKGNGAHRQDSAGFRTADDSRSEAALPH